jgi:hypothetical protein
VLFVPSGFTRLLKISSYKKNILNSNPYIPWQEKKINTL